MTLRVVFTGAANSGKSTLASEVFLRLKKQDILVDILPEWARLDIQANGPMKTINEQYRYLHNQRRLEDNIPAATQVTICDGGTLSGFFFASLYMDHHDRRDSLVVADLFREFMNDLYAPRYDIIFFLQPLGNERVFDGTRYQTVEELNKLGVLMDLMFTRFYTVGNIHVLSSGFNDRADQAVNLIETALGANDGH